MRFVKLIGPATIVSVAYIDPGNFGANLEAGMKFGLALLWVVAVSGLLALAIQYVSGMLGVSRGAGLFDLMTRHRLWFSPVAVAIVLATDMAEFMGVVLGLHLLFDIPLWAAALVGFFDVAFLALLADRRELFAKVIGGFVVAVAASFLIQLYFIKPNWGEVAAALVPKTVTGDMALVAAAIVGATIMPHAVLLHSHIAKGQLRREHMYQTAFNLFGASLINAAILITSAYVLYSREVDIQDVPKVLEPLYGPLSAFLFSMALLLSGISSSAVSVEVGVLTARYIFGRVVQPWKVRMAARLINLAPAVAAVGALGLSPITILVYTQAVLAATLPIVLTALWHYTKGLVARPLSILTIATAIYTSALVISTMYNSVITH
ncbi:MAG: Nramp family divalent metal transporter [Pyrobaculum sp.]